MRQAVDPAADSWATDTDEHGHLVLGAELTSLLLLTGRCP
jgi:hypothetical protein